MRPDMLAPDETVILHHPLCLWEVFQQGMERGCQQHDSPVRGDDMPTATTMRCAASHCPGPMQVSLGLAASPLSTALPAAAAGLTRS